MGYGMPYHLEKGSVQRILEIYFNGLNRADMVNRVRRLQGSVGSLNWLNQGLFTALPAGPGSPITKGPPGSVAGLIAHLAEDWFGLEGVNHAAPWRYPTVPPRTTGYWYGYSGDVVEIMRQGFQWAMQLALGPQGTSTTGPPPLKIEILWKCPNPWFEMWVLRRPIDLAQLAANDWVPGLSRPALVTVIMATPPQLGAEVSLSPIATKPTTWPPGARYAVPSTQVDYELLGQRNPQYGIRLAPPENRPHAMWVVTHGDHVLTNPAPVAETQRDGTGILNLTIPQGGIYQGTNGVVTVSPSLPAGGVLLDGAPA